MTPQNPEELSVWLAVFKSRVRDGLLFESAEDEANAALAEHREGGRDEDISIALSRVAWLVPSYVEFVGTWHVQLPGRVFSFSRPGDTLANAQQSFDAIERSVSARIDEMLERLRKVEAEREDLRRMGMLSPRPSNPDPSLAWLAEAMRHAPPPEHCAPYCAYMRTVEGLAARSDEVKAVKVALADVQREHDELVKQHAAAMDVEQAKRQAEREQMLHELGKLHELLAAASGYVTDVFNLSADPVQRARVRKLLHEIGKVISPTLIALPNDGE